MTFILKTLPMNVTVIVYRALSIEICVRYVNMLSTQHLLYY